MENDSGSRTDEDLKKEIEKQREIIEKLKVEANSLKKAIWDMLNYANVYVLLLDKNLIIRLINYSLARDLGYKNEKVAIGHCWLDHVPPSSLTIVRLAHRELIYGKDKVKYREVTNDLKMRDSTLSSTKWFNIPINSKYNMTFSVGIKLTSPEDYMRISEDSIRSYYKDIIEKDRSMIKSLREVAMKNCDEDDELDLHECIIELKKEEEEN